MIALLEVSLMNKIKKSKDLAKLDPRAYYTLVSLVGLIALVGVLIMVNPIHSDFSTDESTKRNMVGKAAPPEATFECTCSNCTAAELMNCTSAK